MIYDIISPQSPRVPILLSVPHCGIEFPDEIRDNYVPELIRQPDDTDWFVDRLYDFAPEMGITLIRARYSRWIIDLNRDPESKPLYDDGRAITGLTPDKTFAGEDIYRRNSPDKEEVQRRLVNYYYPYHQQLTRQLKELKESFGIALLYDAHSIRRRVPSIYEKPFPDLILGDNDEKSAHPSLIQTAWEVLENGPFEAMHNTLFRGGQITRHFGQPEENIHALQLEMSKDLYMDDSETNYHPVRAGRMRQHLKELFSRLIDQLNRLSQ